MPRLRTIQAGERYGKLVVSVTRRPGEPAVRVRCDCGTELSVTYGNLGRSAKSCGCTKKGSGNGRYRHGMAGTKVYMVWSEMVARCTRPSHKRYADYGGRGISVCDRWRDFANFYVDMGQPPPGLTLDRINNDGGYAPGNCRWATLSQQASNRRSSASDALRDRARREAEAAAPRNKSIAESHAGGATLGDLATEFVLSTSRIRQILQAHGTYQAPMRTKRPAPAPRPRRVAQHGSRSKYNTGCRCDPCREAENGYRRERWQPIAAKRTEKAA